jgi:soluble lytic murein transglycosylase-like protein
MEFPFDTGASLSAYAPQDAGEALKEMGNQIKTGKGGRLLLVKPCGIYALRAREARFKGAGVDE